MPKKVLFCATVDIHFQAFHLPYMKWFQEQGWEVHAAAQGRLELPHVDRRFEVPIQRSPFRMKNLQAYQQLKKLIDEQQYEIIHCHTPMGGVLTRLAARQARVQGTKVIYTAHGFHFCKGAPMLSWLLYYPIEKLLSYYTDCLITINHEDFELATNRGFRAGRIEHVHGVGVSTERFRPIGEHAKRHARLSLGYGPDDFLMIYAAEFNRNKNQQLLLEAMALIKDEMPEGKLLLAGAGPLQEACRQRAAELGIADRVQLLGHRRDLDQLLPICDAAVASSLREGLPVNIMEAMACSLPVIATDNRGHRELVRNEYNGYLIHNQDVLELALRIRQLARNRQLRTQLGAAGRELVEAHYSTAKVLEEKQELYTEFMEEKVKVLWAVP